MASCIRPQTWFPGKTSVIDNGIGVDDGRNDRELNNGSNKEPVDLAPLKGLPPQLWSMQTSHRRRLTFLLGGHMLWV